jgi:hypothetical protein
MNPVKRETVFDFQISKDGSNKPRMAKTKGTHGEGKPPSVVDIGCSARMGVSLKEQYVSACLNQSGCSS